MVSLREVRTLEQLIEQIEHLHNQDQDVNETLANEVGLVINGTCIEMSALFNPWLRYIGAENLGIKTSDDIEILILGQKNTKYQIEVPVCKINRETAMIVDFNYAKPYNLSLNLLNEVGLPNTEENLCLAHTLLSQMSYNDAVLKIIQSVANNNHRYYDVATNKYDGRKFEILENITQRDDSNRVNGPLKFLIKLETGELINAGLIETIALPLIRSK